MKRLISAAVAALFFASPASALGSGGTIANPNTPIAPLGTAAATITATGTYSGELSVLTDGVIPANGSTYNLPDKVAFGDEASFRFDFGGVQTIESLLANVDNNDNYLFQLFNGSTLVGSVTIFANDGLIGSGVETFTRSFAPVAATYAIVSASGGDHLNSMGEVQFRTNLTGAVPEPATWAMMLLGFGGIGFQLRRRSGTQGRLARTN
jgi:hypothetical protein